MQTILYSKARNNLRTIIDDVCDNSDEYIINTKQNKSVVVMAYDEYSAIKETMYLLSSVNNRDNLLQSITQIENGNITKQNIGL
jgi:antitoxin YefM